MPEIKHQFTSGKMNKDLDERLVPNGEYKDAMNIQVSTSEGSDVGTIQNILGNSLVPGQGFISEKSFCVGSIADEKNDKLYYFISSDPELIEFPNLDSADGFQTSNPGSILVGSGRHQFGNMDSTSAGFESYSSLTLQNPLLEDGQEYLVTIVVDQISNGVDIRHNPGSGVPMTVLVPSTNSGPGTYEATLVADTSVFGKLNLYHTPYEGSAIISHLSLKKAPALSYIIEYDSKTNSITPVLIDSTGEVLKFSSDRLITGINIIDDMLFWTDNHSEPKKINIPRSIQGTDSSGLIHTKFINEDQNISSIDIKEEHITVIKKSPKNPPTIELISGRDLDLNYTGVMRVTNGAGGEGSSSLRNVIPAYGNASDLLFPWGVQPNGGQNNFSNFGVGDNFYTYIETDLNGESGFTLEWGVGDIVVFKEFDVDEDGVETAPSTPITDYTIKAKIINSSQNEFVDGETEQIQNGSFETSNSNGYAPKFWDIPNSSYPAYDSAEHKLVYDGTGGGSYGRAASSVAGGWVQDARYKLTIKISNYISGNIRLNIVAPLSFGSSSSGYHHHWATPLIGEEGTFEFEINTDYDTGYTPGSDYGWNIDTLLLQTHNPVNGPTVLDVDFISVERLDIQNAGVQLEILDIPIFPPVPQAPYTQLKYAVDKFIEEEKLFEFKFPRFAYRYQYQDKEYSNISPFSPVAFLPGSFDYHPKKGYNLGMTNRIDEIKVKDFVKNAPDGVIAIDILYKEEVSPNIYVVDTIKPKHSELSSGGSIWATDEYVVKSEILKQVLPSNQILRPWDAVPRKALAQDVTGNRIVYGNYVQNYDLKYNDEDYYPDFDFDISGSDAGLNTVKSIKSLREYQLGVVFIDEYGRETPVATNTSGFSNVTKIQSNQQNKIKVAFNNNKFPHNMKYFKFFIKETSGEYYNMAMDRWYDADDGHVWLSFPSSDRNKVDVDTFLILKKGLESNDLIEETARYKILAIENEAPEFIKTRQALVDERTHDTDSASITKDIFGTDVATAPLSGRDTFKMKYRPFYDSSGSNLHEISDGELYVEFGYKGSNYVSERYRISNITTDLDVENNVPIADAFYSVKLDRVLGDDVDNIVNDASNPSKILNGSIVKIYRYDVDNKPRFDGRFFVKVINDDSFASNISINNTRDIEFRTMKTRKLYYMNRDIEGLHHAAITGLDKGKYAQNSIINITTGTQGLPGAKGTFWDTSLTPDAYNPGDGTGFNDACKFGRFAPFFRNYKHADNEFQMLDDTGGITYTSSNVWSPTGSSPTGSSNVYVDAGRFAFGKVHSDDRSNQPWKFELAHFTARGDYFIRQDTSGGGTDSVYAYYDGPTDLESIKFADDHDYSETERSGKFNNDGEQTHGNVWFIDAGPIVGTRAGSNLYWSSHTQLGWNDSIGNETFSVGSGINASAGTIEIATNVFNDEVNKRGSVGIGGFFDIGVDGGNTFHDDSSTQNLVSKISSGQQWRWKEDPSGEVYTFIPTSNINKNRIRWNADRTPWMVQTEWSQGSYSTGYNMNIAEYDVNNFQATGQLSPNFTKGYKLKFENEQGETTLNWDPTNNDTPGPIENGLHLSVNATSDPTHDGGFSIINPYIRVADIHNIADTNTGITHSLHPGLILESHSDDGTPIVFDDTTPGKEYLIISKIVEQASGGPFNVYFTGYQKTLTDANFPTSGTTLITAHNIFTNSPAASQALVFRQPAMNGYSQYSVNRINQQDAVGKGWSIQNPGLLAVGYTIEFVEQVIKESEMPNNPAIWETEPKDVADLAIYYEASGYNPLTLTEETKYHAIPVSTKPVHEENQGSIGDNSLVNGIFYNNEDLSGDASSGGVAQGWHLVIEDKFTNENPLVGGDYIIAGSTLSMTKPDGSVVTVTVTGWANETNNRASHIYIKENLYGPDTSYTLNWHNCYSFGNGVESNRIRDNFNLPFILNGVKVSTVLEGGYKEEHRKYGLIYSGIYNSTSGINNLNQFIMAEKITKEVNPIYGSIQKLHSRDTDLVTLCEDKILKILANKDAVFNADGNPQLTANENVLGQTVPFMGEFGISKNPESFASEDYRVYFTDRVRGSVMRLSKDGLTPISNAGMKDWFRDNLSLGRVNVLGENNLSSQDNWDIAPWDNSAVINGEAILGYYNKDVNSSRYGKIAGFKMNNVLEIGKTYRLQFDVIEHSGLQDQYSGSNKNITVVNMFPGSGWISGGSGGTTDGEHINVTWTANTTDFELIQYQVNGPAKHYTPPGGITYPITGVDDAGNAYGSVRDYVHAQRIADGAVDSNDDGIPDDHVEDNVLSANLSSSVTVDNTGSGNDGYTIVDNTTVIWSPTVNTPNGTNYLNNIASYNDVTASSYDVDEMESGQTYYITLTVSNYDPAGSGSMGFSTDAGVPANMRLSGNGTVSAYFVSNGARPDLFAKPTNSGTMEFSAQKVISSKIYPNINWLYGGIVKINNLIIEEVKKENLKIIGSYDDRQDEYNVTIHGTDSNTVSFKEDVKGWVSFKSFTPENALSCANDYYTVKNGKLWQHHNPGINRNTFYGEFTNSSFNAILNDAPSSIKSYHTLDYEGSQSRIEGIKQIDVDGVVYTNPFASTQPDGKYFYFTDEEWDILIDIIDPITGVQGNGGLNANSTIDVKQYRNNILIKTGPIRAWNDPLGGGIHGRWNDGTEGGGDWQVGDIITTQLQEDSVNAIGSDLFNSTPANGWYVSGIETNKEKGSLHEFVEKEGKWFNYIRGIDQTIVNEQIQDYSNLDFGSFEIQGLGTVSEINVNKIFINGDLNASLQVGDVVYYETLSAPALGFTRLDSNNLQKAAIVTQVGPQPNAFHLQDMNTHSLAIGDYCMFVKNQVINMNGLSGYYADVMFENNSRKKAELFSVSSEITESSK